LHSLFTISASKLQKQIS